MAEQSEPWWKAVLTAFLQFIAGLVSNNRAQAKAVETVEKSNEVENRVDAADDQRLDLLRDKWTRD